MTLQEVVLAVLRDRYLQLPRDTMERLSRDIVAASLSIYTRRAPCRCPRRI
jgi:hypothetical protein